MINRRSFLKRLGLLTTIPFLPASKIDIFAHNPHMFYHCYIAQGETFGELLHELKEKRSAGILTDNRDWKRPDNAPIPLKRPKDLILLQSHNIYKQLEHEIRVQARFENVYVTYDGFENVLVMGYPATHGEYSSKTAARGKELMIGAKQSYKKQMADYKRLNKSTT